MHFAFTYGLVDSAVTGTSGSRWANVVALFIDSSTVRGPMSMGRNRRRLLTLIGEPVTLKCENELIGAGLGRSSAFAAIGTATSITCVISMNDGAGGSTVSRKSAVSSPR